jgi:uncharacterized membrane protein
VSNVISALRSLFHLAVIVTVTVWGFLFFNVPIPGVFWGVGACLLAILVWALFLSPRPVLKTDIFGQGLVELAFIAGGLAALLVLHVYWLTIVIFGVLAMAISYIDIATKSRR